MSLTSTLILPHMTVMNAQYYNNVRHPNVGSATYIAEQAVYF